jgi:hypothetical protein
MAHDTDSDSDPDSADDTDTDGDGDTTTKATAPRQLNLTCLECEQMSLYRIRDGDRNGSTASAVYDCGTPDCGGQATLRIGTDSTPEGCCD